MGGTLNGFGKQARMENMRLLELVSNWKQQRRVYNLANLPRSIRSLPTT